MKHANRLEENVALFTDYFKYPITHHVNFQDYQGNGFT